MAKRMVMNQFYQQTQLSRSIVPGKAESVNKFWSKKAMSP